MNVGFVILIILAAIGVIYLIIKAHQAARERERLRLVALQGWATQNGFTFSQGDVWNYDARYRGVGNIGTGHNRYALEILRRDDPVPASLFRYHYKTWETRTVRDSNGNTRTQTYEETHWRRYLIIELGGSFPELYLRPEGWFDRLKGFMGFDDIDFESEDFSKRYFIKSADKQFAYAVIHPQVMEWMMDLQFEGTLINNLFVMDLSASAHTADECQRAWSLAGGFINRIPTFVWQDYGKRPPVQLPQTTALKLPPPDASGPAGLAAAAPVSSSPISSESSA